MDQLTENTEHIAELWNYDDSLCVKFLCEPNSFKPIKINGEWHYVINKDKMAGLTMKRVDRDEFNAAF